MRIHKDLRIAKKIKNSNQEMVIGVKDLTKSIANPTLICDTRYN